MKYMLDYIVGSQYMLYITYLPVFPFLFTNIQFLFSRIFVGSLLEICELDRAGPDLLFVNENDCIQFFKFLVPVRIHITIAKSQNMQVGRKLCLYEEIRYS